MICDGYFLLPNILPKLMVKDHSLVIFNIIKINSQSSEDACEQFERITCIWVIFPGTGENEQNLS